MFLLKHNTASQVIPLGFYLDSTDGDTAEIGLTIANTDLQLWKTGATSLVNKNSGGATHMSIGVYQSTLDATDTNTLGPVKIYSHVAGALVVVFEGLIVPVTTYDALITNGLNNLGGAAQSADNDTKISALPTNAEFNARTLPSASYFDFTSDAVQVGTNNDKTGYSISGTKQTLDALNDIPATAIVTSGAIQTAVGAVVNVGIVQNLNTIDDGAITSTTIAANALNGKGDWNIGKAGYSLLGITDINLVQINSFTINGNGSTIPFDV